MDTLNENKDFFDSITSDKLDNLENEIKCKSGRPIKLKVTYVVKIDGVEHRCKTYKDIRTVTQLSSQTICNLIKGKKVPDKLYRKNIEITKL